MTTLLFRPSRATAPPPAIPARPTDGLANAVLEISYTDPNDPKDWRDESPYLRGVSYTRGANDELEQPGAGRLTARIDNRTGRYTPSNTAGPHYPNILPVRSVRLSAETFTAAAPFTMRSSNVGGSAILRGGPVFIPLFTGYIEQWPQEWNETDATAEIGATDGFALLNLPRFQWGQLYQTLNPDPVTDWPCLDKVTSGNVTPAQGPPYIPNDSETGTRMHRVLDCVDWPEDQRDIDTHAFTGPLNNNTPFNDPTNLPVDDTALNYLQQLALMDGGKVFMDPRGYVKFIGKRNLPSPAPEVYGDAAGEFGYTDIETSFGLDKVWNSVTTSSAVPGGTATVTRSDATSIARFYKRPKAISILYGWNSAAQFLHNVRANELLARYKDPIVRITRLTLRPKTTQQLRVILGHDLADAVVVRRRPPTGDMIEQTSRIDQIDVATPNRYDWQVTWQLSAV